MVILYINLWEKKKQLHPATSICFFFVPQKTVRDKEYKGFQIKLERLEKLCRALQTERNELNEKVEILKEQVSLREADVDLAVQVLQSCTLNSHDELESPTDTEPGIQPSVESQAANRSEKTVSTSPVPGTESVD